MPLINYLTTSLWMGRIWLISNSIVFLPHLVKQILSWMDQLYVAFYGEFLLIPALNTWIRCTNHHKKNGTEQIADWSVQSAHIGINRQTLLPLYGVNIYDTITLSNSFVKNLEHWNVEKKKVNAPLIC